MDDSEDHKLLLEDRERESSSNRMESDRFYPNMKKQKSETFILEEYYKANLKYTKWRWIVLLFLTFCCFGGYYWYDIPTASKSTIQTTIIDKDDKHKESKFNQLCAITAYTSLILPAFGGYLIDNIGLRTWFMIFSLLVTLGQFVFMIATMINSDNKTPIYITALIGRLIFGTGRESLDVCRVVALTNWFLDQEFGFAFSITVSVTRLGNVINDYLTKHVSNKSLELASGIGLGFWIMSVAWWYVYIRIEERARNALRQSQNIEESFRLSSIK